MLRSLRHYAIMSHQRYITTVMALSQASASLTKCIRQYLSRMSCFRDLLPQLFHFKMAHNVIILGHWLCDLDMSSATGGSFITLGDNNHHYHLLTRNKLDCVSLFMQMPQPFQTWVLWHVTVTQRTETWTHRIVAINNIQDVWCLALAWSHAKPRPALN